MSDKTFLRGYEPDHNADDSKMDTIYRQAAIDTMCAACWDWCDEGVCKRVSALQQLPPAQSEIIRCNDCRWGKEVCGNIECFVDANVPPEYHGYDWFCPNGERRTDE